MLVLCNCPAPFPTGGKPTVREWAKRDIIGERLTMKHIANGINRHGNFIVTANVDGNYDKRGLPDPLVLAFYRTVQSELIVSRSFFAIEPILETRHADRCGYFNRCDRRTSSG
jgi:hypothetical protein